MIEDIDHEVSNYRQDNHAEKVQKQSLLQFLGRTFSEKLIKRGLYLFETQNYTQNQC